jgi:hypothetical protein
MTQNEMVLSWLKKAPIGPMQALNELGVYRLASRINDLREAGNDIETTWDYVIDRHGHERRVARYVLKGEGNGSTAKNKAKVGKGGSREEESSTSGLGSWLRLFSLRKN